jgi:hypothetical protein
MNRSKEKPLLRGNGPKDQRTKGRCAEELVLALEAFCAQIEIRHELRRLNRALLNKDIEG